MKTKFIAAISIISAAVLGSTAAVVLPASAADPTTFVYAGDSITARSDSWLYQNTNTNFQNKGGFARAGWRSDQVLSGVRQTNFLDGADVAVIEVGSNDVNQQVPTSTILANIDLIAGELHARHTLLVALPPANPDADSDYGTNRQVANTALNPILAEHAMTKGWLYADPFAKYRKGDGSYVAGATDDAVHPNTVTNKDLSRYFMRLIQQTESGSTK